MTSTPDSGQPGVPAAGPRVVAVVVTWNRRDLLLEALAALDAQTLPPGRIVVVDNASTDGTGELLASLAAARPVRTAPYEVVTSATNLGGAGGFALGIEKAVAGPCDAVWVMDDDTIPATTALEELVRARSAYQPGAGEDASLAPPTLVASRVEWTDGRAHPMNTPRIKPGVREPELAAARAVGCVPVRTASFVSVLLDAERVREVGLPVAGYFLWNDDFEYSARIVRDRRGLLCPASVVLHKTTYFGSTDTDPGPRFAFEVRNKVWMFTRSPGLTPAERLLYAGSTGVRWLRTVARSSDRATLGAGLLSGLRQGLGQAPPDTAAVIHGEAGAPLPEPFAYGQTPAGRADFTVLMAYWQGDDPDQLAASLASVTTGQTRPPAQVVLVQDGPVPSALRARAEELAAASSVPVTLVHLPANLGLGGALTEGLRHCEHDIVARQDADDLSLPERFARQVPLIEAGATIVGSSLLEFDDDPQVIVGRRVPVTDPAQIAGDMRFHQTFFHPTVVYRRSAVQAVGGYEHVDLLEDYLLFAKLIRAGVPVANVAEPLVLYRVGAGAYGRRGGMRLLRSEVALQRRFRQMGFTSPRQSAQNLAVRGVYRLVPESVRKVAYRSILARRGERGAAAAPGPQESGPTTTSTGGIS